MKTTIREFLLTVLPAVQPNPPPSGTQSPTGRTPLFLWTPHQQDVWARMRVENHPYMTLLFQSANATVTTTTADDIYGDFGSWAVIAYQITGDVKYGNAAKLKLLNYLSKDPSSANAIRDIGWELCIFTDWLWPVLTQTERDAVMKGLNRWCEWCNAINTAPYVGGWRMSDSDQTAGQYFMCVMARLLMVQLGYGDIYPDWINYSKVGGLDATAISTSSTARNACAWFCKIAEGGEWPVSSEYNWGEIVYWLLSCRAISGAVGRDVFPEFTRLIPQLVEKVGFDLTPDLKTIYEWGDDETPRSPHWWDYLKYLVTLEGTYPQDGWLRYVVDNVNPGTYNWQGGLVRGLYVFDPYAPKNAVVTPTGVSIASGCGHLRYKNADRLFGAFQAIPIGIDHGVTVCGDFQLYSNGEWVITHPIGYGDSSRAKNTTLLFGMAGMPNRKILNQGGGADWAYQTSWTSGPPYSSGYYDPPPEFVHGWTRNVIYIDPLTIVVKDVIDMDNPKLLPKFTRYTTADQNTINTNPPIQWLLHTPVMPVINGNLANWTTVKGVPASCQFLLPTTANITTVDEKILWGTGTSNGLIAQEKLYHINMISNNLKETIVAVISIGTPAVANVNPDGSITVNGRTITFGTNGSIVLS